MISYKINKQNKEKKRRNLENGYEDDECEDSVGGNYDGGFGFVFRK